MGQLHLEPLRLVRRCLILMPTGLRFHREPLTITAEAAAGSGIGAREETRISTLRAASAGFVFRYSRKPARIDADIGKLA